MEAEVETFSKVKRLIRKCIGTLKRFFFSCFPPYLCGILETQELFHRTYFTHKTTRAYLSLFIDFWSFQEILDFGPVMVDYVEGFRHLA